jgi:hypothetical protein
MFTVRNGSPDYTRTGLGKSYCEKILIVDVDQVTPMHFHWSKIEDIINRGGGKLVLQIYNATPDEHLDPTGDVIISTDGVQRRIPAGGTVELAPGESITLPQRCYHQFWGAGGRVLVGEVSSVNDDDVDNRFHARVGRFPEIEEDESPLYLLVKDYPRYYQAAK